MAQFREISEEEKAVVIAVTQHYINMLYNNVIEDNGVECFEGWCEDGDIFDEDSREKCIALMHEAAPLIDELTFTFLNLGY
jgi:hypothetical protein